jgi:hypothetical protein
MRISLKNGIATILILICQAWLAAGMRAGSANRRWQPKSMISWRPDSIETSTGPRRLTIFITWLTGPEGAALGSVTDVITNAIFMP